MQHALRDELHDGARQVQGQGRGRRWSLDVRTGEIVSMVSVPDYDPNNPREALDPNRINRLTTGVYEMGSTFKALTLAMALDPGKITLNSTFDARVPLRFGKFEIHDSHPEGRVLTRAGDLHLFVQYRRRAHRARRWGSSSTRRS